MILEPKHSDFLGWIKTTRFLSKSISMYGISDGRLDESNAKKMFLTFFSRSFLRERHWSVIPLWEGNIRILKVISLSDGDLEGFSFEDGSTLHLASRIQEACLNTNNINFHIAALDTLLGNELLHSDETALTITSRLIDFRYSNLDDILNHRKEYQHWGNNFLWPDDESFGIYATGDSAAFIAGPREKIESMIGLSYEYCKARFMHAHSHDQGFGRWVKPFEIFCDEFSSF